MANIKSAKKRISVINRRTKENRLVKSALSTEIKKFRKLLDAKELEKAEASLPQLVKEIDEACSKGVLHKNNASRKVSRLYLALNNAKNKVETKTEEVAKVTEEKVEETPVVEEKVAKKSTKATKTTEEKPAKKTATKKTTAKSTEEKTTTKKATKSTSKDENAKSSTEKKPAAKKTTAKKTTKEAK